MKIILTCLFFVVSISTMGQEKIKFSTQNFAGLLEGEYESNLQVQTINGMRWKSWFAGVGAGIDWYFFRSIPVFLSVDRHFFQKNNRSVFISADGGINVSWPRKYFDGWENPIGGKFYNGEYFSSGLGYRIGLGKSSNAILLHLGYSYKHAKEKVTTVHPCLIPPCPEQVDVYDFHLRRLSLRIGWGF
jgi:hypothetical protein